MILIIVLVLEDFNNAFYFFLLLHLENNHTAWTNTGQVVRIFTSSTFTDMLMERNCLMEYVYPKIKEYCREKHGLEYQVISIKSINSMYLLYRYYLDLSGAD